MSDKIEIETKDEYATNVSNLLEVWHDNRELTRYWNNNEYQYMMLEFIADLTDLMVEHNGKILDSKFEDQLLMKQLIAVLKEISENAWRRK